VRQLPGAYGGDSNESPSPDTSSVAREVSAPGLLSSALEVHAIRWSDAPEEDLGSIVRSFTVPAARAAVADDLSNPHEHACWIGY
jgi:hypothetical protein